jgi:hypothetical protein
MFGSYAPSFRRLLVALAGIALLASACSNLTGPGGLQTMSATPGTAPGTPCTQVSGCNP